MKTSTGFITQCCNCKNLRHLWLWAVPAMRYLIMTAGAVHRDSSRLSKWRKKPQNQSNKTPKQPKTVKSFLYSCLLVCRIRDCSPLRKIKALHMKTSSPVFCLTLPRYWVTGFTGHHKLSLEAVWVWVFFPTEQRKPRILAASCFKSKGKQMMWHEIELSLQL